MMIKKSCFPCLKLVLRILGRISRQRLFMFSMNNVCAMNTFTKRVDRKNVKLESNYNSSYSENGSNITV